MDELYACGYCAGSGSVVWQRKGRYPEGTYGALDQEKFAKVKPYIETVTDKVPRLLRGEESPCSLRSRRGRASGVLRVPRERIER